MAVYFPLFHPDIKNTFHLPLISWKYTATLPPKPMKRKCFGLGRAGVGRSGHQSRTAPKGRLVIPVGGDAQELLLIEKDAHGTVTRREVLPVEFVPMTGEVEKKKGRDATALCGIRNLRTLLCSSHCRTS